jgi:hypothetical protein
MDAIAQAINNLAETARVLAIADAIQLVKSGCVKYAI